jgi:type I restriction enzyme, S subunit
MSREDWKSLHWGELVTLEYGRALRNTPESGPVPVYGTNGQIGWTDGPLCGHPSVIVGRKGAYRGIHYAAVPFFVIDTAFYLEPRGDISVDMRWAYYQLLMQDINGLDTGSAIPSTTRPAFYAMPVLVPPLVDQVRIGGLLGALDDKIELNRKTSATLEELARALFASRFGDLDPAGTLDGWNVASLADHVEVTRGLSYTGAGLADDGIPLHNLDSIANAGGYRYEGLKHYRGDYRPRHVARGGDLLVVNTDLTWAFQRIAQPALVPERFGDLSLFSHHLYRMRPKPSSHLTASFLYLALMSPRLRQVIVGYSNGTTVNMLPADSLQRPRLAVPPASLAQRFDGMISPIFAKQAQLQLESETLALLRDVLLPKLMSGEIRLKGAEKAVAEAL